MRLAFRVQNDIIIALENVWDTLAPIQRQFLVDIGLFCLHGMAI